MQITTIYNPPSFNHVVPQVTLLSFSPKCLRWYINMYASVEKNVSNENCEGFSSYYCFRTIRM